MTPFSHSIGRDRSGLWTAIGLMLLALAVISSTAMGALTLTFNDSPTSGGLEIDMTGSGRTLDYYFYEWSTNGGSQWYTNVTANSYFNNTIIPWGTNGQFRLEEYSISGNYSTNATPIQYVLGDVKPSALVASSPATNQVVIQFQNNAFYETGFLAERSTNSDFANSSLFNVAPVVSNAPPATTTNWTQTDTFGAGLMYYYRLYATNSNGKTLPSTSVSIAPNQLPDAPWDFAVHTTDIAQQLSLLVTPGLTNPGVGYVIQISGPTTNWSTVFLPAVTAGSGTTFTTNSVPEGQTYLFRAATTNAAGYSAWVTNRVDMPVSTTSIGNWYVDLRAATNSSNMRGTNWANAWLNFSSVRWASVQPGDFIWVAGGNYNEFVYARTPGSGAPVIIHVATNSPQAGTVNVQFVEMPHPYTILDGSLNDGYVPLAGPPPAMFPNTNNIGIHVSTTSSYVYFPIDVDGTVTGCKVLWCDVGPGVRWSNTGQNTSSEGNSAGINFANAPYAGAEIGYCYIHDIVGNGVMMQGENTGAYGVCSFHHNILTRYTCNWATIGLGCDIFNNYALGWWIPQVGHPDGWQGVWGYNRIYNNWLQDTPGYLLYPEGATTNQDHLLIYGNVLTFNAVQPSHGLVFTTEPSTYSSGSGPFPWPLMNFTNVLIANNTFVNADTLVNVRDDTDVTNLYLRNWQTANNVFASDAGGVSVNLTSSDSGNHPPVYSASDFNFDYNVVESGLVNYSNQTTLTGLAALFPHNLSNNISFANLSDYHMTNALAGTNLSSVWPQATNLNVDMDGVTRTTWQRGAFETRGVSSFTNDPSLIVWYRFNATNNNYFQDYSYHHAVAFREDPNHWPTNSPGPTTNVTTAVGFYQFQSQDPAFFGEGQYGAATYTNLLDGMTNATLAFWGKGYVSPDGTLGSVHNMAWTSAGGENDDAVVGSWYFGRMGSGSTYLIVRTNISVGTPIILTYPDTTTDGSTAWHHYAWTFDGSQFIGYFDGSPFQTNSSKGVGALHVSGNWLALSSWPHNGTPQWNITTAQTTLNDHTKLDDGYPNAGWINGAVADFRIYSSALTPSQVSSLYAGSGGGGGGGGTPSQYGILVNKP